MPRPSRPADIAAALGLPPLPSNSPDTMAALVWAREIMQAHQTDLYAVREPNGIDEIKPVMIGGCEQWITIRGRDKSNPVFLFLHGGPGAATIGASEAMQRPFEDYFTVVIWDQRQVGKSYYPADDENAPLSIEQHITDTEELIAYLREYLGQKKVIVVGSSWGTVLGMHIAKRRPEWLHAYIGFGQAVNILDNERTLCERLVQKASEAGEAALADEMKVVRERLDLNSPDREQYWIRDGYISRARGELSRLAGETGMHHTPMGDVVRITALQKLISPQISIEDLTHSLFGDDVAVYRDAHGFGREFMEIDLRKDVGSSFEVPIFFFSGRHDWQTPTVLSDQWFEEIEAPHKELIHFEESCHHILNEEPGRVLVQMVNRVLPFAEAKS